MAQQIGEDTKVTLDLKTIGMIVGFTISLCSMYFVLQADIAKAMELPAPEVTKTEFTYKDQIIRDAIMTCLLYTSPSTREGILKSKPSYA